MRVKRVIKVKMWCYVLFVLCLVNVGLCETQNCRGEKPRVRECDKLCDANNNCKLRAALLLPKNTTYDACLASVSSCKTSIK